MISLEKAKSIVVMELASYPKLDDDKYIILHEATITKAWGWVFFYTSEKWHVTGDLQYALAGNAPLIVEKPTGNILVTGTAEPLERYLDRYEKTGTPHA